MKITYTFANGDTSTVEVNEALGEVILEFNKEEYNNDHKETRRHTRLDTSLEHSDWLAVDDEYIASLFAEPSKIDILRVAIKTLKPKQQELLKAIFVDGMTQKEYADKIGVVQSSVSRQLETILKKLKKFF